VTRRKSVLREDLRIYMYDSKSLNSS